MFMRLAWANAEVVNSFVMSCFASTFKTVASVLQACLHSTATARNVNFGIEHQSQSMKTATILTALLVTAATSFAQKVEEQPVEFNYTQLPETPLDASITGYQGIIAQSHEGRVADMRAQVEADQQQAEYDYQQAMAQYNAARAEVDREYEEAMAVYNSKSAGDKILESAFLNQEKPLRKPYPYAPRKRVVDAPYYPKVYGSGSLATYASIVGMKKNTGNDVIITITMDGFELGGVSDGSQPHKVKNSKTGVETTTYTFWKSVSHKHGMAIRVEAPGQGIIMDEYVEAFGNFRTSKTNTFRSKGELDRYWYDNQNAFLNKLDDDITMAQLKQVKNILDNRYGFLLHERKTIVRTVKPKKFDYSDMQSAYEDALVGYNNIERGGMEKTEAKASLSKSCATWESVIAEYDPNAKKARVTEKVAIATRLNLIEAYIFMDDYDKAKMHHNKLIAMGNKKVKRQADALQNFLEDQKQRYLANTAG